MSRSAVAAGSRPATARRTHPDHSGRRIASPPIAAGLVLAATLVLAVRGGRHAATGDHPPIPAHQVPGADASPRAEQLFVAAPPSTHPALGAGWEAGDPQPDQATHAGVEVGWDEEALEAAAAQVDPATIAGTLELLLDGAYSADAGLRDRLLRRWVEVDAPEAASWAAALPSTPDTATLIRLVATAWGASDTAAAMAWVNTLPPGPTRAGATVDLAYEMARSEPLAALELIAPLGSGAERDALLLHAASQWAPGNPMAAEQWALQIPDRDLQQQMVETVAIALAETDPVTASRLTLQRLAPGPGRLRAVVSLLQRWATPAWDAVESRAFTQHLPTLLASWTTEEPDAAHAWMRTLPESARRLLGTAIEAVEVSAGDTLAAP